MSQVFMIVAICYGFGLPWWACALGVAAWLVDAMMLTE